MFDKILVPLDRSRMAEFALKPALRLANQTHGTIVLMHVPVSQRFEIPQVVAINPYSAGPMMDQAHMAGQEYLNSIQYALGRTHVDLRWSTLLIDGDPASKIVDAAADRDIDLIVMSTHGYSGITRWVLGSVAEKVLRAAPCPVLTVRAEAPIKKIMIALDGSSLAESCLIPGFSLAQAFDAQVVLFQAILNQENGRKPEADYLQTVADNYVEDFPGLETAVYYGTPAQQILTYAENHQIDLIVVATHGRSGLSRWAYGSVTEKVLRGSNCALLIVRPPKDAFDQ